MCDVAVSMPGVGATDMKTRAQVAAHNQHTATASEWAPHRKPSHRTLARPAHERPKSLQDASKRNLLLLLLFCLVIILAQIKTQSFIGMMI